jgi:DNA-binding Lrp family transcriptional regulator
MSEYREKFVKGPEYNRICIYYGRNYDCGNIYDTLSRKNTNINGGIVVIVAFIMAKVESTKSRSILELIRSLDEVEEAYLIYGAYDLLIKSSFKTPEGLSSFVVNELRKVDGIKDTVTNVCASCD